MLLITNRATATAITAVTTTTMSATTTTVKRNEQPTMWKTNKTNPKGCCFFCCCCWHLLLSLSRSRVATPCCSYNLPHLLLDLLCDTTTPPTQISRGDLRDLSDVLCIFYDKQAIATAAKPAAAGGQPGPDTCETGTEDFGLRSEGET